jgi:hypothetical protein
LRREFAGPAHQGGIGGSPPLGAAGSGIESGHHLGHPLRLLGAGEPGGNQHHDALPVAIGRHCAAATRTASNLDLRHGANRNPRSGHLHDPQMEKDFHSPISGDSDSVHIVIHRCGHPT